jgi:hypothetical protein
MGIVVSLQVCIWPVSSSDHVAWCGARPRKKFRWGDRPWLGGVLEHPLHVVPFFPNPPVVIEERETDAINRLHQGIAEKRDSEGIDGYAERHVSSVLRQDGEAGDHEGRQHDHPGSADDQKKQKDTAARLAGKLNTSFERAYRAQAFLNAGGDRQGIAQAEPDTQRDGDERRDSGKAVDERNSIRHAQGLRASRNKDGRDGSEGDDDDWAPCNEERKDIYPNAGKPAPTYGAIRPGDPHRLALIDGEHSAVDGRCRQRSTAEAKSPSGDSCHSRDYLLRRADVMTAQHRSQAELAGTPYQFQQAAHGSDTEKEREPFAIKLKRAIQDFAQTKRT